MMLAGALLLVICAGLFALVDRREALASQAKPEDSQPPAAVNRQGGFKLVLRHRYLLLIAAFSLLFNWVNSNGEYMLSKVTTETMTEAVQQGLITEQQKGDRIAATYASFFSYVNIAGVVLQTFVVSRLVRWLGLSKAFLFLPVISIANAGIVAFLPFK